MAVRNWLTVIPASIKVVVGILWLILDMFTTKNTAPNAPRKAKIDMAEMFIIEMLIPNTIAILAPKAAPEDIPIT